MKFRIHRLMGLSGLMVAIATGCLVNDRAVMVMGQKGCAATGVKAATKAALSRLATRNRMTTQNINEACRKGDSYSCNKKVFSPDVADGRVISQECVSEDFPLGKACFPLDTQTFSTLAASKLPNTSPEETIPGGAYNYSEYTCFHRELQEEGNYLIIGTGDSLQQALKKALEQCSLE